MIVPTCLLVRFCDWHTARYGHARQLKYPPSPITTFLEVQNDLVTENTLQTFISKLIIDSADIIRDRMIRRSNPRQYKNTKCVARGIGIGLHYAENVK